MESKIAAELTGDSEICDNEDEAVRPRIKAESGNSFTIAIILDLPASRARRFLSPDLGSGWTIGFLAVWVHSRLLENLNGLAPDII